MLELFGRKKARKRLNAALRGSDPPSFPQGVLDLMRLLRDPDADTGRIAETLAWDPGLVVRVLKMVNSAAFGLSSKVDCVRHAVTVMGRSRLEQLVLGVTVKDNLPKAPARGFEAARFWHAAFFRASVARAIAGAIHPVDQERSFTGALLQDMAVPLLAHARPDDYGEVLEEWHGSEKTELHVLEKSAFGWSHDEIGGHLAVDWELPESLTRLIGVHHQDEVGDRELPPALRLVAVHRETHREHGTEAMIEEGRAYGLEPDWIRSVVQTSDEHAFELAQVL